MISIIIPTYNNEATLKRTLESVCSQTCRDIEVIVVNDGSTDRTHDVAEAAASRDARIRVFSTPNRGAYHARLYGIERAKGQWITFADADDTLPVNALQALTDIAQEGNDIDIAVATINLNNRRTFRHQVTGNISASEYIATILTDRTSVGLGAKLYRRTLFNIEELNSSARLHQNEDLLMLLTVAREARVIRIDNDSVVYNYLFRPGSASGKCSPLSEWFTLFDIIGQRIKSLTGVDDALTVFKINTIYREGVLKLNDFSGHDAQLRELAEQATATTLSPGCRKRLRVVLSPVRRTLKGVYVCSVKRTKNTIKKLIGRE